LLAERAIVDKGTDAEDKLKKISRRKDGRSSFSNTASGDYEPLG
jgi:hypothetical protein